MKIDMNEKPHNLRGIIVTVVLALVLVLIQVLGPVTGDQARVDVPEGEVSGSFLEILIPEFDVSVKESYILTYDNDRVEQSIASYKSALTFDIAEKVYHAHLQDLKWVLVADEEIREGFVSMYFQRGSNDVHIVLQGGEQGVDVTIVYVASTR